jgi:hypothetical protein
MSTVVFPLAGVLLVAEHALAATSHAWSILDGTPRPALVLIANVGAYLMSNGLAARPGVDDGGGLTVVYAEQCQTQAGGLSIADELNHGDAIRAVLPLLEPTPDLRILHRDLTAGAAAGALTFVIELDARHLRWHLPAAGTTEVNR